MTGPGRGLKEHAKNFTGSRASLLEQLCDVGARRIAEMDAAEIDIQVLSLTSPGVEQLDAPEAMALAREANEFVADAVRNSPTRFAGFATIPTAAPDQAADELECAVRDHGFKGAMINGHVRGRYLDDKFFWPILERAQSLKVPIYLHPTQPPQAVLNASYGGFAPAVSYMLANAGWGWHIETAIHVIRLVLGGAFDRYPRLQVIIGHLAEGLPFMMQRLDAMPPAMTKLERPISAYLRENLHYYVQRLQLHADLPEPAARGRRRADHVLGRSSLRLDAGSARLPESAAGQHGRQGANRARQRGASPWLVSAPGRHRQHQGKRHLHSFATVH